MTVEVDNASNVAVTGVVCELVQVGKIFFN